MDNRKATKLWVSECMEQAFEEHGRSQMVNTDEGSQFTSPTFTELILEGKQTKLNMYAKGRALDNGNPLVYHIATLAKLIFEG